MSDYYKVKGNYKKKLDESRYIEYPMSVRTKLVLSWIPENTTNLLDVGCAWGYGTRFLNAKNIYAIEPHEGYVDIAKKRYPKIKFFSGALEEKNPFKKDFFDAIVLIEVFEHVENELKTLNEIFKILKPRGILIMTMPHKFLFPWLDSENYIFWIRKHFLSFYKLGYKLYHGRYPVGVNPGYEHEHRAYRLKELITLLDKSNFRGNYRISKVFRSGFLMAPISKNIGFFVGNLLSIIIGKEKAWKILEVFNKQSDKDYKYPYGAFSSDIAIKIQKI